MEHYKALIVDDEPDIRELLEMTLGRMGIDTTTAADLGEAFGRLRDQRFDLCLTDMRLPDGNGIELVGHIQEHHPELPVAVITAFGSMETAIAALKAGAFDFVSKPVDLTVLRGLVEKALKLSSRTTGRQPAAEQRLLGESPAIHRVRELIAKLARSQAPVYISGESGTGKELVARLIHENGPRADMPFVPVNCGAIPSELMESEFFGHRKGSFTGALTDKPGLFQAAHGGTLFLDEAADLPMHMQVKLLRAIQEKAVRPIGAQKEVKIDVRILSATHKDLGELVQRNAFRQDLYYRINVIELHVPSLRDHPEDIPLLAESILRRLGGQWGQDTPQLDPAAIRALTGYPFPGNVRELENILERAMTLCEGNVIRTEDLHLPQPSGGSGVTTAAGEPLPEYLGELEREAILQALEETRWNRTAAARKLGITFRALRYRLKKLGIE
ncbi:sigma-54-dependent transcriptional regulator [Thioalbus denitrificans]|uniref:Two-component response regulator PilR n=1 Tax=Thioalbus denitrificans TaxID=547122 RepID=A0A369C7Z3_9GAMM|nr:sigma-54 dependent transcriptional regulator [Thioalbus denitrificans]RCX29873.1 two-component response regulator PilR [Thioalbus denitrificans]